jgi:hypothetical protein
MFDPQTSGGLIIGICAEQAGMLMDSLVAEDIEPVAMIGEVIGSDSVGHVEIE